MFIDSSEQNVFNSLHAGYFCMLFCCLWILFCKSAFSKRSFRNTIKCQTVWIQIRYVVLSGLIWFQTVFKGYQTTKVSTSGERVKLKFCVEFCYMLIFLRLMMSGGYTSVVIILPLLQTKGQGHRHRIRGVGWW